MQNSEQIEKAQCKAQGQVKRTSARRQVGGPMPASSRTPPRPRRSKAKSIALTTTRTASDVVPPSGGSSIRRRDLDLEQRPLAFDRRHFIVLEANNIQGPELRALDCQFAL